MNINTLINVKPIKHNGLASFSGCLEPVFTFCLVAVIIILWSFPPDCAGKQKSSAGKASPSIQKKNFPASVHTNEKSPVSIEADAMDYDHVSDLYRARGQVSVFYSGASLYADEVELDNQNHVARAQGNTLLKIGEDTLKGERLWFNIEDKTGAAFNADAFYARNHFRVRGNIIEKTGENTYFIDNPSATTCDGSNPDWEIAGSEMKVTIEGYGLMKNACFKVGSLPLLYSPYILFPAKTKRQTGFLLPYLAYSRDKDGIDVELPFFWAVSPWMDATFYQRFIEKRGFKEGAEFRYDFGNKSFGTFYGDYLEDTKQVTETEDDALRRDWQGMHKRWSYFLHHQTRLDSQFYLRTDLKKVSDKWYFRDFSSYNYYREHFNSTSEDRFRNVSFEGDKSLRYLDSTIRVYKGWSKYNVTGLMHAADDFAAVNNDQTLQRYPEIIFAGVKQPLLHTPFYYELAGRYDYLYKKEGHKGHFADLSPSLSMPVNLSDYVRIIPQFTFKETFWSRDDDENGLKEKTADRSVYNASVSFGSQLFRVFHLNGKHWEKIRHEIKPEIIYSYMPSISAEDVPDYYLPALSPFGMPLASLSSDPLNGQNAGAWSLTNTLTARVKDQGGSLSYLEFFRLKVFQAYDIDEARRDMARNAPERRPFSDMGIEFDFSPHKYFSFRMRDKYNVYSGWKQNSYDLSLRDWRGDALLVAYRNTEGLVEEINLGVKAVITDHFYSTFVLKRDLQDARKIENSLGFVYHTQCWSLGFDLSDTDDDVRFLFRISLAGFGKTADK
ncbi:MAG: LPS-assembly protein LptD [Deltaproteobacteria bacterium]|nr:LPS-assembly protein LptD [Deltaproteobacteria bacterium]